MNTNELINALMPYIISASATILAAIGAWLGTKVKGWLDTKEKKQIVEATVKYVEQVGKALGSEEKLALAKEKALEWVQSKGLKVGEVELEILIEAFVNDFYGHYEEQVIEVNMEQDLPTKPEITN